MGNLEGLVSGFKPRRAFECGHTKIEVDGVFVRVDDSKTGWERVGKGHYRIPIEDILLDPSVIRSARVSTGRDSKEVDEKSVGLINFLWRDNHVTPLEGLVFRLRIWTPIPYAQPLFRLFASDNEHSGRYSVLDEPYHTPGNVLDVVREEFDEAEREGQAAYQDLIGMDIAKEMARLVHLYRFPTKFYMTISLRHLLEFLSLENVPTRHTATEFWEVKKPIREMLECWTPWAMQAFDKVNRRLDFSWVSNALSTTGPTEKILESYDVLDKGEIHLREVYGNDLAMLRGLDDFPDPRKGFGHGGLRFSMSIPIHVFRQWVRHRYGHWTEFNPDFDKIVDSGKFFTPQRFRTQTGKVGAYTYADASDELNDAAQEILACQLANAVNRYWRLRELGVHSEIAAMNLPYRFFIPVQWSAPAESLMNFFSLRCDGHAQQEIRDCANVVWDVFRRHFPLTARVFAQHLHYGDSALIKKLV